MENATPKFYNTSIRQTLKLDLPANERASTRRLRLRISNAFGTSSLLVSTATIGKPSGNIAGTSQVLNGTIGKITFDSGESEGISIPPGALAVSDAFDFDFAGLTSYVGNGTEQSGSIVTITLYLSVGQQGDAITSHPGSRTTSFLASGDQTDALNLTGSEVQRQAHWYFISAVESLEQSDAKALVLIGDSITDGRGTVTDANNRWPDFLFTRLQQSNDSLFSRIAILNQAAGGNRVLLDGLGPSALSRIDRDVLSQSGVRYALLFSGVNDIGSAAADPIVQDQLYKDLVAGYRQIILRIRTQSIAIFGTTITPFGATDPSIQPYSDPAGIRERTRTRVNAWIRESGEFDAIADFDATVRDPVNVTMLRKEYDSGDFLHLNPRGYEAIARSFPLALLR